MAHPSCPVKKAGFRQIHNNLQLKLRVMQNDWWINLTVRTELCVDDSETSKALYDSTHQTQSQLCSADEQALLQDKTSILFRWSKD